jgi:hypothetical protein
MEPTDLALVGYRVAKDNLAYPNFTKVNPAGFDHEDSV